MRLIFAMRDLKEKQKLAWEGMFYSIQRIDLLIVSICGAGIYVCLELIKHLTIKEESIHILVKLSGACFLFGIIVNFLSQIFGYISNKHDFLMYDVEINAKDKPTKDDEKSISKHDKKSTWYSDLTEIFNYSSMGLMSIGLILIMCYFFFTF